MITKMEALEALEELRRVRLFASVLQEREQKAEQKAHIHGELVYTMLKRKLYSVEACR